ncbi:T9SS type A sorting domain-containing protein [Flavobacterium sp. GT3P67]|uniref:T9SS type A sorting domain-containing protein n=1 Tax=Flavobacterium sp. GT3P67 TaxID=2541722 RepID=UPI00104C77C5|nr:T9SS type A sorting domain-containing protein [Flavobacterium sp. GT3P67]TDE54426.1 T9SS type A sorting domain-containing protein [Flavobacterium sp. GT3P67]
MKNTTLQQFFGHLPSKIIGCFLPKNKISSLGFLTFNESDFYPKSLINSTHIRCFIHDSLLKLLGERTFFSFRNACMFLIVSYLSSFNVFAQVFPDPKRCTSKDLQLVEAKLTGGDPCNSCTPGNTVIRTLTLSINNTTGSNRTSFAFWGTLERYNGTTFVSSESISGCNSTPLPGYEAALPPNQITALNFGNVTYLCGQRLVITNLYLAWTAATDNASCPLESSKIAPKCGTLPFIEINAGVNGTLTAVNATCTAGGSITVAPFGGLPPYSVKLGNGTPVPVVAGGSTIFTNLAVGNYNVTITDSTLPNNCSIIIPKTVGGPTPIAKPAATVVQPTCSIATGTVNVTSPVNAVAYTLKQSDVLKYTAVSGVFSSVVPGIYEFAASIGICSTAGDNITVNSQPATPSAPSLKITQPSLCGPATGSIEVCNPIIGYTYKLNGANPGVMAVANVPVIFSNLAAGSNPSVTATSPANCTSSPANCSSATATCAAPSQAAKTTEAVAPIETKTETAGFTTYPVPFKDQLTIRYDFDYKSDVKIEVFDSQGISVLSKSDTNSYLNKEVTLDLKLNRGRDQVYVVKVTTNRGSSIKKVISSE